MITNKVEFFTADEAIERGIFDAIKRGETKLKGSYVYGKEGILEFRQQAFIFTDKVGNLRVGKFKTDDEILKFIEKIRQKGQAENGI